MSECCWHLHPFIDDLAKEKCGSIADGWGTSRSCCCLPPFWMGAYRCFYLVVWEFCKSCEAPSWRASVISFWWALFTH